MIGLTSCKNTPSHGHGTLLLSKSEVIIETSGGSTEVEVVAKNTSGNFSPCPKPRNG